MRTPSYLTRRMSGCQIRLKRKWKILFSICKELRMQRKLFYANNLPEKAKAWQWHGGRFYTVICNQAFAENNLESPRTDASYYNSHSVTQLPSFKCKTIPVFVLFLSSWDDWLFKSPLFPVKCDLIRLSNRLIMKGTIVNWWMVQSSCRNWLYARKEFT